MRVDKNMVFARFDGNLRANYEKNKVEYNRKHSAITKKSREDSKGDTCFLCGAACTSFCNSHSVPRFCLEHIAMDGHLLYSNTFVDLPFFKYEKGLNEAGTFHIICRDCDSRFFADYENESNYLTSLSDKMMAQIAVKNSLKSISKRRQEIALYENIERITGKRLPRQQTVNLLDLQEYIKEFEYAKKAASSKWNDNYYLAFYKKLNYVTPLAFQSNITLISDFNGTIVNDIYDISPNYHNKDIHICVFPLLSSTVVAIFVRHGENRYSNFFRQLKKLEEIDALSAICYIILAYSEDVFFYKGMDSALKNDKELIEVMQQTTIAAVDHPLIDPLEEATNAYDLASRKKIPNLLSEQYKVELL